MSRRREPKNKTQKTQPAFNLLPVKPMTDNQGIAFRDFKRGQNLLLHGFPGTGKTFIALGLALQEQDKKVVIVRSAVQTRDIGFQPGNANEKMRVYEGPYHDICSKLYDRGDAYDILKQQRKLFFMPTSFIRGITLDDSVVIIDEAQNMSDMELHSVITRLGNNSRLIICGDVRQDDLTNPRFKEVSGLSKTIRILKLMDAISCIEFLEDDIVRGSFIKDYIITRDRVEREELN